MLFPTVLRMLILLGTLIHGSLAAPASFRNASTVVSTPATPGFRLQGKVNYPRQPKFDASAMLLLTCQILYGYSRALWYAPASNSEQSDSNICIAITNVFEPTVPQLLFQNRHAMWGLWQAALQQAQQDNLQAGVFGLQVLTHTQWIDVAIMTYARDTEPYNLVAAPGDQTADLASRSNEPPAISDTVSPPGTSSTNDTAVSITANSRRISPYPVVIGQAGQGSLNMVKVFNTICQAIIQRASISSRGRLTTQWAYYCQATGYKISLRRPRGSSSESPPYAAVVGGMANLLQAMHEARRDKETAFDVQSETGEVLLQGILIDTKAGEAGSGLTSA